MYKEWTRLAKGRKHARVNQRWHFKVHLVSLSIVGNMKHLSHTLKLFKNFFFFFSINLTHHDTLLSYSLKDVSHHSFINAWLKLSWSLVYCQCYSKVLKSTKVFLSTWVVDTFLQFRNPSCSTHYEPQLGFTTTNWVPMVSTCTNLHNMR